MNPIHTRLADEMELNKAILVLVALQLRKDIIFTDQNDAYDRLSDNIWEPFSNTEEAIEIATIFDMTILVDGLYVCVSSRYGCREDGFAHKQDGIDGVKHLMRHCILVVAAQNVAFQLERVASAKDLHEDVRKALEIFNKRQKDPTIRIDAGD